MRRTTLSSPDRSAAEPRRVAAPRAAAAYNYTAERVLRVLEVVVFRPSTAPVVAEEIGVSDRTARRILHTLAAEEYVQPRLCREQRGYVYVPTARLMVMASQLATRLPLVRHSQAAVDKVKHRTGLAAYATVPAYDHVLVIAATRECSLRPWARLAAASDASGRLLLAHRDRWRESLGHTGRDRSIDAVTASDILRRGHALVAPAEGVASLAVVMLERGAPTASLALQGSHAELLADEEALAKRLQDVSVESARQEIAYMSA
jgi:DNA-binding IclR family transcriptional regulator